MLDSPAPALDLDEDKRSHLDRLAGDVTVHRKILTSAADPDQQLIVMTAETGSPSHDALLRLLPTVAEGGGAASR